jgi:hypothetical protein
MNNVQLTQHIVLIDETLAEQLPAIEARLAAIDRKLAAVVPPQDVRQSMAEASEHETAMAEAAPLQAEQLSSIVTTLDAQMPLIELRDRLENELSYAQQVVSVMQGLRDEILAMRATLRRQSAVLEQVLRARVADEEWEQSKADRRAGERRAG